MRGVSVKLLPLAEAARATKAQLDADGFAEGDLVL